MNSLEHKILSIEDKEERLKVKQETEFIMRELESLMTKKLELEQQFLTCIERVKDQISRIKRSCKHRFHSTYVDPNEGRINTCDVCGSQVYVHQPASVS